MKGRNAIKGGVLAEFSMLLETEYSGGSQITDMLETTITMVITK
ncbi:MAG: hypothetical protein WA102_04340 [Candidatus Methanoperedens sp.]